MEEILSFFMGIINTLTLFGSGSNPLSGIDLMCVQAKYFLHLLLKNLNVKLQMRCTGRIPKK